MSTLADDVSPATSAKPLPAFPGYELLEELGRGGMGVVFKARHTRLNRLCALKMVLAGELANPESIIRFLSEAEVVARLRHPHIVQIHQFGECGGLPFIELEYIDGGSLAQRLDGTPWLAQPAVQLVEALTRAMDEAHKQGIVHRDLKPGNILLMSDGTPKITDFGLAKSLAGDSSLTKSGAILGSPSYMAPEQAKGEAKQVGPAVDVYSLGAILYELLTGRPPFRAPTVMETLEQVMHNEPVPPTRLVPGLPRDLETITLKCLQKEASRRYESARALADDLHRFQTGEPIRARRTGWFERSARWCQRNPLAAGLAMAFAGTLVAGTSGASYFAVLAHRKAAESDRRLYLAEMNLAQRDWQDDHIDEVLRRLEGQEPQRSQGVDLRGFEWHYLERLCHSELRTLRGHTGEIFGLAISADGRRIASAGADETVRLWQTATGSEVSRLKGHKGRVWGVAFSRDGRRVASAGDDKTIRIWDAETGAPQLVLEGHQGAVTSVAFHPDGRHLASVSLDRSLRVWDLATGLEERPTQSDELGSWCVAYSPDGRRLATAEVDGTVRIRDSQTRKETLVLRAHTGQVRSVAFSPDGARLASAGDDLTIRVWEVSNGDELLAIRGHKGPGHIRGVVFSPDGRRLASAGGDTSVRVWDAASGQEVLNLRGHTRFVWGLAFLPDGRRLASAGEDRTIRMWDATTGQESMTLRAHWRHLRGVDFSPDGRRLASAGEDSTIWTWDAETGQELFALHGHEGFVMCVRFSRDGQQLASGSRDGTLRLWDVESGRELKVLRGHDGTVRHLVFSPNGRRLISGGEDRTVRVWDIASGRQERLLEGHTKAVASVAVRPDGRWIASAGEDGDIRIWDAATGRQRALLRGHEGEVYGVAFSPDGLTIASGGQDETVRLWSARSGQQMLELHGHTLDVAAVTFSPDGHRLASASWDGTVRIWDRETGREALTLHGHTDGVSALAFSPDGQRLASASFDNSVRIWDARFMTDDQLDQREALALTRSLAPGQDTASLLAAVQADGTISEAVRRATSRQIESSAVAARARAARAHDEGQILDWLILAPVPLGPAQTGAGAVDQEQIRGEAELQPRAGQRLQVGEQALTWREYVSRDSVIDFNRVVGSDTNLACAYAVTYLIVEREQRDLGLRIGSDDSTRVFLNGQEVHRFSQPREFRLDQDAVGPISLRKGRNVLVFKVVNQASAWAGSVRIVDRVGRPFHDFRTALAPEDYP